MKSRSFAKCVLAVICLLQGLGLKAQDVQLTLTVQAWNLEYLLGNQKDVVTDLTLKGAINAYDISILRSMAKLTKLNLAEVNLVAGGSFYVNQSISVVNNQIPEYMFFNLSNLTSVVLPNSATLIGDQAFQECTGLTSVTIGSNITSIGFFTFANCSGLKSILLPNSLVSIGNQAFWGCSGLTTITIPPNVTSIGVGAFSICTALKEINVSDTNNTFSSQDGVLFNKSKSVLLVYPNSKASFYTVPASVTTINDYAFDSCPGLASVSMGDNVSYIGEGAFYNCSGLMSASVSNNLTAIGKYVFYNCNGLNSVIIPPKVTSIGWNSFGHCTGLTSLDLGSKITSIDLYAFTYCTGLTSVTVPATVTSIGDWAFSYCTGLTGFHSKALTPPTATSYTFYGIDKTTCKLYVPIGKTASYKSATGWSTFKSFIEEYGTGINETNISEIKVYSEFDAIVVEGSNPGDRIFVYNEAGALLQSVSVISNLTRIQLPVNHIYIIKIAGKAVKIAL